MLTVAEKVSGSPHGAVAGAETVTIAGESWMVTLACATASRLPSLAVSFTRNTSPRAVRLAASVAPVSPASTVPLRRHSQVEVNGLRSGSLTTACATSGSAVTGKLGDSVGGDHRRLVADPHGDAVRPGGERIRHHELEFQVGLGGRRHERRRGSSAPSSATDGPAV